MRELTAEKSMGLRKPTPFKPLFDGSTRDLASRTSALDRAPPDISLSFLVKKEDYYLEMAKRAAAAPMQPQYTRLNDTSRYGEGLNLSRLSTERLKPICARHGLSQSGTKVSMINDIEYYLDLEWGGKPKKVTVPTLRRGQGPKAVFGGKHPSPEKTFDVLFTKEMWQCIVDETNRYQGPRVRRTGWKIGKILTDHL